MKITERTMMEQELYGINEDAGLITDGDQFIIESINEYFNTENPEYTLMGTLYESIQYSDTYAMYAPLLEAVDDIKSIERDLEHVKDIRDNKAIADAEKRTMVKVSKLTNWFLSVDPDKKGKTWHSVVMVLLHVLAVVIGTAVGAASGAVIGSIFGNTMFAQALIITVATLLAKVFLAINTVMEKKKVNVNMSEYNESLEKWEAQINKLDDIINKYESAKAKTDDPTEKKACDKAIAHTRKAKQANEDAIKKLKHLKTVGKVIEKDEKEAEKKREEAKKKGQQRIEEKKKLYENKKPLEIKK